MELKRLYFRFTSGRKDVLIVPYGIETKSTGKHTLSVGVLIVPYGIETLAFDKNAFHFYRVNCTLWN